MKIKNIIFSSDENKKYIRFWPTVSYHFKSMGYQTHLGLLTNKDKEDDYIKNLEKYGDSVFVIKPVKNIGIEIQSKLLRFYICKFFKDDVVCIHDIDYYVFDKNNHAEKIFQENKINTYGYNAYLSNYKNHKGVYRYPACPLVSEGKNIFNIFKENLNINFEEFLKNLPGINGRSDESVIFEICKNKPEFVKNNYIYNKRDDFVGMYAKRRIDRGKNLNFSMKLLNSDYYIDLCPHQYYDKNNLKIFLDFLKIPEEIQNINI